MNKRQYKKKLKKQMGCFYWSKNQWRKFTTQIGNTVRRFGKALSDACISIGYLGIGLAKVEVEEDE